MTACNNPRCLNSRHDHALPLSPLQEAVFSATTEDMALWRALMAAQALRGGNVRTAREAVTSALLALAKDAAPDRRQVLRLSEAGIALQRGQDRRAFISLARLVLERKDQAGAIDARLEAADKAMGDAA